LDILDILDILDWFSPVHPLTSLEIFAECLGMLKWIVGPWKLGNQK